MQSRIDTHSRMVAWAKIILPILSLALLSTLFLLSKSVDPISTIPFSDADIKERTRKQQISSPEVFGVTSRGDLVSLKAGYARQGAENTRITEAETVSASVKLLSGTLVELAAGQADYDAENSRINLFENVTASTTQGYDFTTGAVHLNMNELWLESEGSVSGRGPATTLEAGKMHLRVPEGEKDAHLLFSEGVKLIYIPQIAKE